MTPPSRPPSRGPLRRPSRLARALAHHAIYLLGLIVRRSLRDRWLEEWHAEVDHAARRSETRRGSGISLLSFAAGAIADAILSHRLPRSRTLPRSSARLIGVTQDFRRAVRAIVHAPGFTATVVLSLGLGLAANTAAYAFLQATLFPGVPGAADPDRLVRVSLEQRCGGGSRCSMTTTFEDLVVLREGLPSLSGLAASTRLSLAAGVRGQALTINGALVSANYFDVLGVQTPLGRGFLPDEERPANAAVAVIAYGLWQRLFAGDRAVLGEYITVGGHGVRIVGVASPESGRRVGWGSQPTEVWLPSGFARSIGVDREQAARRSGLVTQLLFIGRLDRSSSLDGLQTEAPVAAARVAASRTVPVANITVSAVPFGVKDRSGIALDIAGVLMVPAIVLLIACINASNLLLVRGQQRARDIAVRLAVGASRWRIAREILAECVVLALLSGAVAVALGYWALRAVETFMQLPLALDARTVMMTFITALVSVLGFGFAPAFRVSRLALGAALASRSANATSRSRMREVLVGAQVALSIGLLAAGTQSMSAVTALADITGADDPDHLVMVSFDLSQFGMPATAMDDFYDRVAERVRRMPGVARVGVAPSNGVWRMTTGSFDGVHMWPPGAPVGWPPDAPLSNGRTLKGGYVGGDVFESIGLRLLEGRGFEPADRVGRPRVAIVSRATAQHYYDGHALGQLMRIAAPGQTHEAGHDVLIVGVVESARDPNYMRTPDAGQPAVYVPVRLEPTPALSVYVRTVGDPAPLVAALRAQVDAVDARVPIVSSTTLAWNRYQRSTEERLVSQGLATLGVIALVLATGGLYGAVSFIVSSRRREVGVRMALGAAPRGIMTMMLIAGLRMAIGGAAFGAVIALITSGLVRASMYGIPTIDPAALMLPSALLTGAVLAASLVPARRAARVDPLVVLREE
jgi:putative ABC transport system permease protein